VLRAAAIGVSAGSAGCLDSVGGGGGNADERTDAPSNATASRGTGTATTTGTEATTDSSPTTTETDATRTTTEGETRSTTTEDSTSTATCESGLRRLEIDFPENFELAYREGFGFELSAAPDTVAIGEELEIELRNATDEPQTTGPKAKYAIERQVEDGWRHVLQVPEAYSLPDTTVTHQPGEGFTWRFLVSQEGFSADPYTVCAPLRSGTYHFTYWGFPDAMRGLTIEFDIE
jgi:hypothetical protein